MVGAVNSTCHRLLPGTDFPLKVLHGGICTYEHRKHSEMVKNHVELENLILNPTAVITIRLFLTLSSPEVFPYDLGEIV